MKKIIRKIVRIDEEKCTGCGLCIPACHEGAIQIIDGKARLIADKLCDGLGDCLGECPEGAITIEEREADAYDEEAVQTHLEQTKDSICPMPPPGGTAPPCGCVSSQPKTIERKQPEIPAKEDTAYPSYLGHWPVQLALIPPQAKFLRDADLLIVADCVPLAFGDFHRRFIKDKAVAIACPKFDDVQPHLEKLAEIFQTVPIRSVEVIRMQVPCCSTLKRIVEMALDYAGLDIPLKETVISISGEIIS